MIPAEALLVFVDELRTAAIAYERAVAHAEQLRVERNQLIIAALEEGWTHAAVAEATGLSRGRVGQLDRPSTDFPIAGAY